MRVLLKVKRLSTRTLCSLPLVIMIVGCLSMRAPELSEKTAASDPRFSISQFAGTSQSGCSYQYRVYEPASPISDTHVMLAHGFLRDQGTMVGLSSALAASGVPVITLDLCNMRLWNGHHERNALDMRSLANELGVQDDIIYAGFSAGALAAVLAADNDTRAILALDPVDQEAMAVQAIRNLSTPLIGFSGPPSSCNANGNAEPLFTARSEQYLSRNTVLPAASHCSFEVEAVLSVSTRSAAGLEPVSDS